MQASTVRAQSGQLPVSSTCLRAIPACHFALAKVSGPSTRCQSVENSTPARMSIVSRALEPRATAQVEAAPTAVAPAGRTLVFAADGTDNALQGLRWIVRHVARAGDTIHLAHVITDDRTPSTAVGSSAAATQWSPSRDEQVFAREFLSRAEKDARELLSTRFAPELQFAPGVEHTIDVLRLKTHKSAASIGHALSDHAIAVNADFIVIASHGAGVQCEFGSVARWCTDNSAVPALLLPPAVLHPEQPAVPSNTVMAVAVDDAKGLQQAFKYAAQRMARAQDSFYLIHVCQICTEEDGIAARKSLVSSALRWQQELAEDFPHVATLNVAVDVVTEPASDAAAMAVAATMSIDGELAPASPAGEQVCSLAEELNARSIVLAHHGRSMVREMQAGPVTTSCAKMCARPLVVLDVDRQGGSSPYSSRN